MLFFLLETGYSPPHRSHHPLPFLSFSPIAQASAAFPENTLASFEAAIRDGAEGIESG